MDEAWLAVDFGTEKVVRCIKWLRCHSGWAGYCPREVNIHYSSDGTTWETTTELQNVQLKLCTCDGENCQGSTDADLWNTIAVPMLSSPGNFYIFHIFISLIDASLFTHKLSPP